MNFNHRVQIPNNWKLQNQVQTEPLTDSILDIFRPNEFRKSIMASSDSEECDVIETSLTTTPTPTPRSRRNRTCNSTGLKKMGASILFRWQNFFFGFTTLSAYGSKEKWYYNSSSDLLMFNFILFLGWF